MIALITILIALGVIAVTPADMPSLCGQHGYREGRCQPYSQASPFNRPVSVAPGGDSARAR